MPASLCRSGDPRGEGLPQRLGGSSNGKGRWEEEHGAGAVVLGCPRPSLGWVEWGAALVTGSLAVVDPLPLQQGPHPASHQPERRGPEPLGHPEKPTLLGQKGKRRKAGLGSVGVELIPGWGPSSFPFFVLDPVLAFQWFGALSTVLTYLPALLLPSGG